MIEDIQSSTNPKRGTYFSQQYRKQRWNMVKNILLNQKYYPSYLSFLNQSYQFQIKFINKNNQNYTVDKNQNKLRCLEIMNEKKVDQLFVTSNQEQKHFHKYKDLNKMVLLITQHRNSLSTKSLSFNRQKINSKNKLKKKPLSLESNRSSKDNKQSFSYNSRHNHPNNLYKKKIQNKNDMLQRQLKRKKSKQQETLDQFQKDQRKDTIEIQPYIKESSSSISTTNKSQKKNQLQSQSEKIYHQPKIKQQLNQDDQIKQNNQKQQNQLQSYPEKVYHQTQNKHQLNKNSQTNESNLVNNQKQQQNQINLSKGQQLNGQKQLYIQYDINRLNVSQLNQSDQQSVASVNSGFSCTKIQEQKQKFLIKLYQVIKKKDIKLIEIQQFNQMLQKLPTITSKQKKQFQKKYDQFDKQIANLQKQHSFLLKQYRTVLVTKQNRKCQQNQCSILY